MKIVVFGYIHANLPAFEAVLKAAHDERPARVAFSPFQPLGGLYQVCVGGQRWVSGVARLL